MAKRVIQYQDVCKIGMTGAIMQGDFLADGGDGDWVPDMYVRQALALQQMAAGGNELVAFDYKSGLPAQITENFMTSNWMCYYKLPVAKEGTQVVVKFSAPEYMKGQPVGGANLAGDNYLSFENSPVTGGTAVYLDKACTKAPTWKTDSKYGQYFICPDDLYFKMVAGEDGSAAHETGGDYSMVRLVIQYAAKDNLDIYQ